MRVKNTEYNITTIFVTDGGDRETVAAIDEALSEGRGVLAVGLSGHIYRDPKLGLSSSDIRDRHREPTPRTVETFDDAANFGKVMHARVTGVGPAPTVFPASSWADPRHRHTRNQLVAGGGLPLLMSQWPRLGAMWARFHTDRHVRALFREGGKPLPEVAVFWVDEFSGLKLKARPDFLTTTRILDYKTLPAGKSFREEARKWGYDLQAAWYQQGVFALTGTRLPFTFITQSVEAPYRVGVHQIGERKLEEASTKIMFALNEIRQEVGGADVLDPVGKGNHYDQL